MTKVTIITRVEAPKIPSRDLSSYPTDNDSRINEATPFNPLERDMVDRNRKKGKFKLLNFKKDYIVPALNVRIIRRKSKQEELMQFFSKNRIDILGILDHKIIHDVHS